ncbi:MAG: type II toxin-antitoxin system HigB family toxin [Planctomycetes bacterium]|nr:type II toxin-antitoxin system HigB family toxin [Planctomycetota bacterium]
MRIIKTSRLGEFIKNHPDAKEGLLVWKKLVESRDFKTLHDLSQTINSVDMAGKYHIFNIKGNDYRLITAVHYNTGLIFIRDFQSHAKYSKQSYQSKIDGGKL